MPKKPSLPPLRPAEPAKNGSSHDAWQTEDPAYSVDRFYTRATNDKDHGEYIRVKLAPEVIAELNRIVASGIVPEYESPQDIIRDAIVHRVRWLNDQRQVPLTELGRLMLLRAELARLELRQQVRAEILQRIQRVASSATRPSDEQAIIETLRARLLELDPDDRQAIVHDVRQSAPLHVQRLVDEALREA